MDPTSLGLPPGAPLRWLRADEIHALSRGAIVRAASINARTGKPERGGIACAKIFGPTEDLSCLCTKYRGEARLGITCEKCGVEVALSSVRCSRAGHLDLPIPVAHPWDPDHALEALLLLPAGLRGEQGAAGQPVGLERRTLEVARSVLRLSEALRAYDPTVVVEVRQGSVEQALGALLGSPGASRGRVPTLHDHVRWALSEPTPPPQRRRVLASVGLASLDPEHGGEAASA